VSEHVPQARDDVEFLHIYRFLGHILCSNRPDLDTTHHLLGHFLTGFYEHNSLNCQLGGNAECPRAISGAQIQKRSAALRNPGDDFAFYTPQIQCALAAKVSVMCRYPVVGSEGIVKVLGSHCRELYFFGLRTVVRENGT